MSLQTVHVCRGVGGAWLAPLGLGDGVAMRVFGVPAHTTTCGELVDRWLALVGVDAHEGVQITMASIEAAADGGVVDPASLIVKPCVLRVQPAITITTTANQALPVFPPLCGGEPYATYAELKRGVTPPIHAFFGVRDFELLSHSDTDLRTDTGLRQELSAWARAPFAAQLTLAWN